MSLIGITKEKSDKIGQKNANQDMIRSGMIAELDAVSLYQSHIENIDDEESKKVITHIMNEEKEHIAELACILMKQDLTQEKEIKEFLKSADISKVDCTKHRKHR